MKRVLVLVGVVAALAAFPGAAGVGAKGKPAKRQLQGTLIAAGGASISVGSRSASLTCALTRRADLNALVGATVRLTCRQVRGRLVATRILTLGKRLSVEVNGQGGEAEAKGTVTSVSSGSITVQAGPSTLTCQVPPGMDLTALAGRTVELHCRLVGGAWVVTRIEAEDEQGEVKVDPAAGRGRAEARGTVTSVAGGSVTVSSGRSTLSCRIPDGSDFSPFLGRTVELKCALVAGVWTVTKIETEDGGDEIKAGDDDSSSGPGSADENDDDRSSSGAGGGDDDGGDDRRGGGGDDD
jgi:hypothetical protein